ncbi:unnamed protein product [Discosporangium mesarthrocarpum]
MTLSNLESRLFDAARAALVNSYSPYSNFPVACAALTNSGRIITGANVENVSYGATVCAERVTLFRTLAEGLETKSITQLAIVAETPDPILPCGACLQVIAELAPQADILCFSLKGEVARHTIASLLPHRFSLQA